MTMLVVVAPACPRRHGARGIEAPRSARIPRPAQTLTRRLRQFFTEAADPSFSRVQLLNDKGEPVNHGDTQTATDSTNFVVTSADRRVGCIRCRLGAAWHLAC
jgi:hypothetical protein